MAEPRAIPGFYYDIDRKKYFRVQPNHKTQANAPQSKQNVEARKQDQVRRTLQQSQLYKQKLGSIIRKHCFDSNPRLQSQLGGTSQNTLQVLVNDYAGCLQPVVATKGNLNRLCCFDITPKGSLYVAGSANLTYDIIHATANTNSRTVITDVVPQCEPQRLVAIADSALAVGFLNTLAIYRPSTSASIYLRPTPRTYIFDLATHADTRLIAYASEHGLSTCDTTTFARSACRSISSIKSEQMTLTFKTPNLILSGERTGAVNFTDIRAPETVHRLHHSNGVNGICSARNPNHIVTSGLTSTCIYDLRFSRQVPPKAKIRRHTKSPRRAVDCTEPLVRFYVPPERTSDHFHPTPNVTYISDLNILVTHTSRSSVTRHNPDRVTLYDVSTGKILTSPLTNHAFNVPIRGIQSARTRDAQTSVFVLTTEEIHEWGIDHTAALLESTFVLGKQKFPSDAKPDIVQRYAATATRYQSISQPSSLTA